MTQKSVVFFWGGGSHHLLKHTQFKRWCFPLFWVAGCSCVSLFTLHAHETSTYVSSLLHQCITRAGLINKSLAPTVLSNAALWVYYPTECCVQDPYYCTIFNFIGISEGWQNNWILFCFSNKTIPLGNGFWATCPWAAIWRAITAKNSLLNEQTAVNNLILNMISRRRCLLISSDETRLISALWWAGDREKLSSLSSGKEPALWNKLLLSIQTWAHRCTLFK